VTINFNFDETVFFTTKDSFTYEVNKITPNSKELIKEGFSKLSNKSVMFRFLELKKHLSEKELEYLSNPDGIKHVAFGAIFNDGVEKHGIGVARYIKTTEDTAELAVTIIDEFQGKGIGKNLVKIITLYAKKANLKYLIGTVNCYNESMMRIVRKYPNVEMHIESGNYEICFDLENLTEKFISEA
jgi:RimJ/RimL family protein N-acetyltransferase